MHVRCMTRWMNYLGILGIALMTNKKNRKIYCLLTSYRFKNISLKLFVKFKNELGDYFYVFSSYNYERV